MSRFSLQVYAQVAKLFKDHSDLLEEFSQFLPDTESEVRSHGMHIWATIHCSRSRRHKLQLQRWQCKSERFLFSLSFYGWSSDVLQQQPARPTATRVVANEAQAYTREAYAAKGLSNKTVAGPHLLWINTSRRASKASCSYQGQGGFDGRELQGSCILRKCSGHSQLAEMASVTHSL